MRKRVARANTILDYDDLLFLFILNKKENKEFVAFHFEKISKNTNMSYNAFLTHLNRLKSYGFVRVIQPIDSSLRFQGKKINFVSLTDEGFSFLDAMLKTPGISDNFKAYKNVLSL